MNIFEAGINPHATAELEQTIRIKSFILIIQRIIYAGTDDNLFDEKKWTLELANLLGVQATSSISVWASAVDVFLSSAPIP